MKQVNMKQSPKKMDSEISSVKMDQPAYPYGLQIRLDKESLEKLGIKKLPEVGKSMKIEATVEVVSVHMNESSLYGDNKSVELQITDMALSGGSESED